ncbi:hypothetical protein Bca4012_042008 [Brassica carinata]
MQIKFSHLLPSIFSVSQPDEQHNYNKLHKDSLFSLPITTTANSYILGSCSNTLRTWKKIQFYSCFYSTPNCFVVEEDIYSSLLFKINLDLNLSSVS